MTDVFEFRTGKFTPLGGDVLAKFNDEQRVAYDQLTSAVAELNAANLEAESTPSAPIERRLLRFAKLRQRKRGSRRHTFLDELRASQAQWREDHP